ncbi:hypothetical protein K8R43_02075 [archaeon]|nr:hypothetical protein [archaeon]
MGWKIIVSMLLAIIVLLGLALFALVIFFPFLFGIETQEHNTEVTLIDSETGQPLSGLNLIVTTNDSVVGSFNTNPDGKIEIKLPPGEYTAIVNNTGFHVLRYDFKVSETGTKLISIQVVPEEPCEESWKCGEWGECSGSIQTRTCIDENECNTTKSKPSEIQACFEPQCESHTDCDDNEACTLEFCVNGKCVIRDVSECTTGDDCCPTGCNYDQDRDCPTTDECQEASECDDGLAKTIDYCLGTPKRCAHKLIMDCANDDGYCPPGCHGGNDNDCSSSLCYSHDACDRGNDCEQHRCIAGACVYTAMPEGSDCDGGTCCSGECTSGAC